MNPGEEVIDVRCVECDCRYGSASQAEYCARQDRDPRAENERFRTGEQSRVVRPLDGPR